MGGNGGNSSLKGWEENEKAWKKVGAGGSRNCLIKNGIRGRHAWEEGNDSRWEKIGRKRTWGWVQCINEKIWGRS